jgi:hypothetical protein
MMKLYALCTFILCGLMPLAASWQNYSLFVPVRPVEEMAI